MSYFAQSGPAEGPRKFLFQELKLFRHSDYKHVTTVYEVSNSTVMLLHFGVAIKVLPSTAISCALLELRSIFNKIFTVFIAYRKYGQPSILKLFLWARVHFEFVTPPPPPPPRGVNWHSGWAAHLICVREIPGSYPGIQIYSNLSV
jgi:hypothetical protein